MQLKRGDFINAFTNIKDDFTTIFLNFSFSSLSHTNLINEIVESLISDVEWYFQGKLPDYSDIDDYFIESRF